MRQRQWPAACAPIVEWKWQWFLAGVGGLLGLGLVRGLLRLANPVAVAAVAAYGIGVLLRKQPEPNGQPARQTTSRTKTRS